MQGGSIIDIRLTGHGVEQFTTPRLVGRRLLPADLDFLVELHESPEVMETQGGVRSRASTEPFVRSNVAHWRHYQFGLYILSTIESPDDPIGRAGLRWDRATGDNPAVDLSVVLTQAAWGQGLAVEAGKAAVAIARNLELPIVAGCRADHVAARGAMEKVGLESAGTYTKHGSEWTRFVWPQDQDSPANLIPRNSERRR